MRGRTSCLCPGIVHTCHTCGVPLCGACRSTVHHIDSGNLGGNTVAWVCVASASPLHDKSHRGTPPDDGLYAFLHDTIIPHHRRKVVHDITHLRRTEVGEMRSLFFKAKATTGLLPTMALHAILHDTIIPHRRRKVVHDITHHLPYNSKARCWIARFFLLYAEERSMLKWSQTA